MTDSRRPVPPSFETRDPTSPAFWDERFDKAFKPWDQSGVPDAFRAFVGTKAPRNVLIPGCGSAYEASWLAEKGWPVKAIDFSPSAVTAAKAQLGVHAGVVEQADYFAYAPPFEVEWIYERAFLCALPVDLWAGYAARSAELLRPGGLLAGFYFLGTTPKGPPFGIERNALDALLNPFFDLVDEHEVTGSIEVFAGRERWLTWQRRG